VKRCKKCGEVKPIDEFYRATGMADGHRSECKACHQKQRKRWYQANRAAAIASVKRWQQENKEHLHAYRRDYRQRRKREHRDAYLRRTFGISNDDYDEFLRRQGGGCAVCGRPPGKSSLHIDHDHDSGQIRGLLCVGCNNALGQFQDSADLLARAADYLDGSLLTLSETAELGELAVTRAGELGTTPV
jgi:recombination endonuclease VII/cytochrome c554/c'-like protein